MGPCSIVVSAVVVAADVKDGASVVADELAVLPLYYNLHHHEAGDYEAVDRGVDRVLEITCETENSWFIFSSDKGLLLNLAL